MTLPRLAFVGTGPVTRAIGAAHAAAGGVVHAVLSRDAARAAATAGPWRAHGTTDAGGLAGADVVIVSVPDRVVAEVGATLVRALAGRCPPLLHTSGVLPGSALLAGGDAAAVAAGSLHPLQSFPRDGDAAAAGVVEPVDAAARLRGVHWFHEGGGGDVARTLVAAWGGTVHALAPGGKALYHAGAAILSNHAVALFADATRLFTAAGVPAGESRAALAALLAGTAANLGAVGVPHALTGPVARGDVATVRLHLDALRRAAPELLDAYRAMARRALVVAQERGSLDPSAAARVAAALDE